MKSFKVLSLLFILIMSGCAKAPIRSDVEGFWLLEDYTILSTGETVECTRLYYSITRMVTEVSDKRTGIGEDEYFGTYIARTEYRDDNNTLVLKDFKVRLDTSDSGEDAPVEDLRNYGINSREETAFDIVSCGGGTMTLRSDYAELHLKKF